MANFGQPFSDDDDFESSFDGSFTFDQYDGELDPSIEIRGSTVLPPQNNNNFNQNTINDRSKRRTQILEDAGVKKRQTLDNIAMQAMSQGLMNLKKTPNRPPSAKRKSSNTSGYKPPQINTKPSPFTVPVRNYSPTPPTQFDDGEDLELNSRPKSKPKITPMSGRIVGTQREDNEPQQQNSDNCSGCNLPLKGSIFMTAAGTFHAKCFKCHTCGDLIGDRNYFIENNNPMCEACYQIEQGLVCSGCSQPIRNEEKRCLVALGKKWHMKCFVCQRCGSPFRGSFFTKDNRPFCSACFQQMEEM